jgi:hypothetical protein
MTEAQKYQEYARNMNLLPGERVNPCNSIVTSLSAEPSDTPPSLILLL